MKHSIILSCILFFASLGWAKNPIYIHLGEETGLPSTQFYSIVQDDRGVLWFASAEGLYKYDGEAFTHYSNPDKKGISVFNLKIDNQGRVWCTNLYGEFYYVESGQLKFFFDVVNEFNLPESLYEFDFLDDKLLIYGKNAEVKVDLITKESSLNRGIDPNAFRFTKLTKGQDAIYVPKVKDNQLAIHYYTKRNNRLQRKSKPLPISNYLDADGKLLAVDDKLYFQKQYPKGDSSFAVFSKYQSSWIKSPSVLNHKRIINSAFYNHKFWYSTSHGLYVFNHLNRNVDSLSLEYHLLPRHTVTDVLKGKNDVFWVSTLHSGIFVFPNMNLLSQKMKADVGVPTVMEVIDDKQILIGTNIGYLGIYDSDKDEFTYLKLPSQGKVENLFYNKEYNQAYISTQDSNKSFVYDFKTDKISSIYGNRNNIASAKSLMMVNPSRLYYASSQKEFLLSINSLGFSNKEVILREELNNEQISQTIYDQENNQYYIACASGLRLFNKNNEVSSILNNGESIVVRSMAQTKNGDLWVAAEGLGLLQIRNSEVIQVFDETQGLLSKKISLVRAFGNTVWFVSGKTIQCYDAELKSFLGIISKKDGLPNTNIIDLQVSENNIWFIMNQGLFYADRRKVFKESNHLSVFLEQIFINGEKHSLFNHINLKESQEKIEFQLNTNQIVDQKSVQFQYRLLEKGNESQEWKTLPSGVSNVLFNSLKAGHYRFQVRAFYLNSHSKTKEVRFDILLPFYKQWWFFLLFLFALMALGYFYFKHRIRKKEKEADAKMLAHKKELEENFNQLDDVKSHLNPNFVSNTLNSIQQFILVNKNDKAKDYLQKFSKLLSIYNAHKDSDSISLENVVSGLEQYLELERLHSNSRFNYTLQLDSAINPVAIFIHPMLILPYVENAVQYGLHSKGGRGWLVVCFSIEGEQLICEIQDDGIGRDKAKELVLTNSISFHSFTTSREELADFEAKQGLDVSMEDVIQDSAIIGTKVTLKMPYKRVEVKSWEELSNRPSQIG